MHRVALVDYGMGNLDSVRRGLADAGADVVVTSDGADLDVADRIVLPGVGAFDAAMDRLEGLGLVDALRRNVVDAGVPFLGICLGMQLLASRGTEGGPREGLGWIPGTVERIEPTADDPRVPHVGWNEVVPAAGEASAHPLLQGVEPGSDCYFVHSYRFRCEDPRDVIATTPYASGITSIVGRANVVGVQFHPEKSQRVGAAMLRNFMAWQPAPVGAAAAEAFTC